MAGTNGGGKSESEKEKTKMRERHRRAITTKIFHGLRKHGGYRLSPRADINEVLRHLATEAGWLVKPDGTTYRPPNPNVSNCCQVCGAPKERAAAGAAAGTPTPSSSVVMGGGECSITASPSRLPAFNNTATTDSNNNVSVYSAMYMHENELHHHHQLQEARASNTPTPIASPLHHCP